MCSTGCKLMDSTPLYLCMYDCLGELYAHRCFDRAEGLFCFRWVPEQRVIAMSEKGKMTATLPILHVIPQQLTKQECHRNVYQCPLYLTASRAGVLNSTGQSTNFVTHVDLPVADDLHSADFVLQGVAAICSNEC